MSTALWKWREPAQKGLHSWADAHQAAMEKGQWQCPQCDEGWMQYLIQEDKTCCAKCGYTGGTVVRDEPS